MAQSVQVRGLDVALARLGRLSDAVKEEVDDECKAAALEMNAEASDYISAHAADEGNLLMSQQVDLNYGPRSYLVYNSAPYAAYVEFGTGVKVRVNPEWVDIANDWRNRPSGTFSEFVIRIREWLARHGGDQANAEYICYLILKNGLEALPFMQTAYNKVKPLLIERVTKIIEDAVR